MPHLLCEVNDAFRIQDEHRFGSSFQLLKDLSSYVEPTHEFAQLMTRLTSVPAPQPAEQFFEQRFRALAACGPDHLKAFKKYVERDPQELWNEFWGKPKPGFAGKIRWLLVEGRNMRRYNKPETHKGFFAMMRMVRHTIENNTLLILGEY